MKERASPGEARRCPVVTVCGCRAEANTFGEAGQPGARQLQIDDLRLQIEIPESPITTPQSTICNLQSSIA
jgi:hypothetical protein